MNRHQAVEGRQWDREAPLPSLDPLNGQTRPTRRDLTIRLSTHPTTHQLDSEGALR